MTHEQKNRLISLLRFIPDEPYLKLMFLLKQGQFLNLNNPRAYNEKLQWLKLHNRKPVYTRMVDKYEAKQYVASIIGEEYIIPTLGVWDRFEDIDFDALPDQFVLKCTHDSGGLVICRDKSKLDLEAARKKINTSLKTNFYWVGREWPYKNVKPRIIAEEYLQDDSNDLKDYKLYTIHGVTKAIMVAQGRQAGKTTADFFDPNFQPLHFTWGYPNAERSPAKPSAMTEMMEIAEKLSKESPVLRVDLYQVRGKIYFGELTFFDGSGFDRIVPRSMDYELGKYINLDNI